MEQKERIKRYSDAEKMEIAAEMVNNNSTLTEMAEKYGVNPHTIGIWRNKYVPEVLDLRDVAQMSESEINQRFETNAAIAKLYAIQKALTLIPQETDIDKLSKLLRELKDINNNIDPTQRDSPWTTEVITGIQKITEQQITIRRENGTAKNSNRP